MYILITFCSEESNTDKNASQGRCHVMRTQHTLNRVSNARALLILDRY